MNKVIAAAAIVLTLVSCGKPKHDATPVLTAEPVTKSADAEATKPSPVTPEPVKPEPVVEVKPAPTPVPTKDYAVTFSWANNEFTWNSFRCQASSTTKTRDFAILKSSYDDLLLDKICSVAGPKKLLCKIIDNGQRSSGACKDRTGTITSYPSYTLYTDPDLSAWQ